MPAYLPKRCWYAAKQLALKSARIAQATLLPHAQSRPHLMPPMLAELEIETERGRDLYLLPMGYIREEDIVTALPQQLALARVRRGRTVGFLTDAYALDSFTYVILYLLRAQANLPSQDGEVRFIPTEELAKLEMGNEPAIRRMSAEQSNSSLIIEDMAVLKVIRHIAPGIHPEAEMGRYLTQIGYANSPAMLGEVTRFAADGTPHTLMIMQRFLHNQGDAWEYTLDTLERAIHHAMVGESTSSEALAADLVKPEEELMRLATTLGKRLGELHHALATPTDQPDFAPHIATEEDVLSWQQGARDQLEAAFEVLRTHSDWNDPADAECAHRLLEQREALLQKVEELARAGIGTKRIRIHGDFHLGQVLVSQGDVFIVDFEGEPARTLEQRREKNSPMRDVAGLLRSFDYAAAVARNSGLGDLSEEDVVRKREILDAFVPQSQQTFLAAYREAAYGENIPMKAEADDALRRMFVLEKSAYEICYEAANRPTWLSVPLHGMGQMADRLLRRP